MICKSGGKSFNGDGFLGLCEKCWQEEVKVKREDRDIKQKNTENIKNKMSSALQNYASVITALLILVGIGISIDVHALYPLIGAIIIGIGQYLFLYAIAEMVQKLQNIEDNTKK